MRSIEISYLGNHGPQHSTENDIRRSLESMGHSVRRIQEGATSAQDVVRLTAGSDLFLWTQTYSLAAQTGTVPERADMLAKIKAEGIPTAGVHLDKWWDLSRQSQVDADPFFRVDHLFTADGGNQDRWLAAGVNHYWLPPGVLRDNCELGTPQPQWNADVGFIGSVANYHHEWPHRQQLVSVLSSRYGRRFRHFGRGGNELSMDATSHAVASLRIVVGDSCGVGTRGCYFSNRLPETLGRGGFLLHPRVDGIEDLYTDGEHLRLFDAYDWDQLCHLVDHYLAHPDEARRIAAQGRALVLSRDTFAHRMETVLDTVFSVRELLEAHSDEDRTTLWEIFDEKVYRAEEHITQDGVVVDCGANYGAFSTWAAQRGARVLAVEPYGPNVERLRRNLAATRLDHRVEVLEGAVSGLGPSVSLVPAGNGRDTWTKPGGHVRAVTLDELLAPFEEVEVLKMDVEGAEFDAVGRAEHSTLAKIKFVTMEFHGPDGGRGPRHFRSITEEDYGRMVARLAETHRVDVIGRPSTGGYLYATRWETP